MGKPENLPHEDLLRELLDTVAEAENVKSLGDLNSVFRPVLQRLGFSLFAGLEIANPRAHSVVEVEFGEGFESWWAHYSGMGYAADDPMIKECIRTLDSFFWSDVIARTELSAKERLIMDDAHAHGLHEGFLAPLHKSEGSIFAVLLAGHDCDSRDIYTRATANLFSSYYGMLGRRLYQELRPRVRTTEPLTARQIECLTWARKGKSSKDIGEILGISEDVVDQHISRACKRLGVRTRMQGVIAAMIEGYFN
jgi:DNA-binding CsgD family transcriptional regulator